MRQILQLDEHYATCLPITELAPISGKTDREVLIGIIAAATHNSLIIIPEERSDYWPVGSSIDGLLSPHHRGRETGQT